MKLLVKLVITAFALWLSTKIIPGVSLNASSATNGVITLVVVALIFGIVNAVLKPVAKVLGCLAYAVTLGLISVVVNGLLFWLTSFIAGKLSLPFHISGFWPAVFGALLVGLVGWLLSLILEPDEHRDH